MTIEKVTENSAEQPITSKSVRIVDDLLAIIQTYLPGADLSIVSRAYAFSEKAHKGQVRRSGEPYIFHPLAVAAILADLRLDLDSIITGLLHDTVEDTTVTLADVQREFGETVAALVDGVTKISLIKFRNSVEKQGENIRKMIVAMGRDVRVVLVKLADRLHNMRTLNHMPYEKQSGIALETLEIYCPLAGRMGIMSLKVELEDLCFRYYRPDHYYQLVQQVKKTEAETDRYISEVISKVKNSLSKTGIQFEIYGRSKHYWSIYRKMQSRNIDYDQVYDVLAFRLIVGTVSECYEALGHIHAMWKPIPGRFKDFIAMPKANNYQSLHTTVIGPGGERIEIQIRTREMHMVAERGIAAHWKYKEGGRASIETAEQSKWLQDLVSWHQQMRSPEEFLETIKTDLMEAEIYVFTPKGEVRDLPDGATPVDFAYAVHTELGNQCVGARVNGKMVPIKHALQNGDTVEIVTSKTQSPSKDWLKFVVTNKAKSKIRAFVKEEQRRAALILGKELVEKEFRKRSAASSRHLKGEVFEQFIKDHGVHTTDELYVKIGYGRLEPRHLVEKMMPPANADKAQVDEPTSFMETVVKSAAKKSRRSGSLVSVQGMDDVLVHFAKCCSPIPGDSIVGFISRGRGIAVHRSDCAKVFQQDQLKRIEVSWNLQPMEAPQRSVKVKVLSQDVPGLLKSMSEAFSIHGINIESAQIRTTKDKMAICVFSISVKDASQLNLAILELQKIRGIVGVQRIMNS